MAEPTTVIEQITEYCDCQNFTERDVTELIDLISQYTCWTQVPCETFLQSERKEVIDLPNCMDDCDIFKFEPFYQPFDETSFSFTLVEQNGLTETVTEITDYIYSVADGNFRLKLPLPRCECKPECGCESEYKLLVTYVAGYELLPDCLLPVFCEALQYIADKNECDCNECDGCDDARTNETYIDETTLEGHLQVYFLQTLTPLYKKQLGMISLCQYRNVLWGVVV